MKIDFSQTVCVKGVPVQMEKDKAATLSDLCRVALNAAPRDKQFKLEEMLQRGRLSLAISEAGTLDVKPEDVSLIRNSLANAFVNPELVTVVYDMLDT